MAPVAPRETRDPRRHHGDNGAPSPIVGDGDGPGESRPGGAPPSTPCPWSGSATAIAAACRDGRLTVRAVADAVLARVEARDPHLRCFLHLDPDAVRAAADDLDRRRPELRDSPWYGVPVAVKDNLSTRGWPTTAGSRLLEGFVPVYDATVVARLRQRGALLIGKTNLDEFSMGSSTENSGYGPTRNPWDLDRVPGGSSGGSAAAVAGRLVPVALGSDTGGSIRQPAALTGILGLKCTYGLVSRRGLIAYASSLDQVGPFARSVDDLALALEAIAGHDPADSTSVADPGGTDYRGATRQPVAGWRVGVIEQLADERIDAGIRQRVDAAIEGMTRLGVQVGRVSLPNLEFSLPAYYVIACAECSSNLGRFDGIRYGQRRDGGDLIEMMAATRGAGFGAEVRRRILLGTFTLSSGYYDAYYLQAMKVRRLIADEFAAAFGQYDLLVSPTSPVQAFKLGEKVDDPLSMYLADLCTISVNLAGLPALSAPVGRSAGLPVGLQLIGPRFAERKLLAMAQAMSDAGAVQVETPPDLTRVDGVGSAADASSAARGPAVASDPGGEANHGI